MDKPLNPGTFLTLVYVVLTTITLTAAIPLDLFYPFGNKSMEKVLDRGDDISSNEIHLTVPIYFYDQSYSSLYINSNGLLTFDTELPVYAPNLILPMGIKTIAVFLADVDTSTSGFISYRETNETSILQQASADVRTYFLNHRNFYAKSVLIVTWYQVGHFKQKYEDVNTFQAVIVSSDTASFSFFNYLTRGINWINGDGKGNQDDPPAQAGFDSGVGRVHSKLPYSGTISVNQLASPNHYKSPWQSTTRVHGRSRSAETTRLFTAVQRVR